MRSVYWSILLSNLPTNSKKAIHVHMSPFLDIRRDDRVLEITTDPLKWRSIWMFSRSICVRE